MCVPGEYYTHAHPRPPNTTLPIHRRTPSSPTPTHLHPHPHGTTRPANRLCYIPSLLPGGRRRSPPPLRLLLRLRQPHPPPQVVPPLREEGILGALSQRRRDRSQITLAHRLVLRGHGVLPSDEMTQGQGQGANAIRQSRREKARKCTSITPPPPAFLSARASQLPISVNKTKGDTPFSDYAMVRWHRPRSFVGASQESPSRSLLPCLYHPGSPSLTATYYHTTPAPIPRPRRQNECSSIVPTNQHR
jgi:hypothetical protein